MDFLTVIVIWIVLSVLVAFLGSNRKIGAIGAFAVSFVLSPLIGFIVVAFSKPAGPKTIIDTDNRVAQEIEHLHRLFSEGVLTEDEYQQRKKKLIES